MIARNHAVAACLILGAAATPALAASSRVFVSGIGKDTGACPQTAPCRSFSYALGQALTNGEIIVEAPGVFSPFTISKSITIANDGAGTAVIAATKNTNGITISAGTSGVVEIRGIEIDGQGEARFGIEVASAAALTVAHTIIRNVSAFAIDSADSSNNGNGLVNLVASVDDTYIRGCQLGISLTGRVTISNTKIFDCSAGIQVLAGSLESIDRVVVSGNGGGDGITVAGGFVVVKDSTISGTMNGVSSGAGYMWIGHDIISGNKNGVYGYDGHIVSYGDNYINGNTGADVVGNLFKTPVTR